MNRCNREGGTHFCPTTVEGGGTVDKSEERICTMAERGRGLVMELGERGGTEGSRGFYELLLRDGTGVE